MTTVTGTLQSITQLAKDVRLFEFRIPPGTIPYSPGAHVDIGVKIGKRLDKRSYSLIDAGMTPDRIMIAVKRHDQGRGGSKYLWSLEVGCDAPLSTARNTFPLTFENKEYILLAAGIGITPLFGMARALRAVGKRVNFHYCAREPQDLVFLRELQETLGSDFRAHLSSQGSRLEVSDMLGNVNSETALYTCGPIRLIDEVKTAWAANMLPSSNLRFESFASSGHRPNGSFLVVVKESGRTVEIPANASMLDVLIDSGHDVMFDCRRGECGLCKVSIEACDSEVDHRDVFLSQREREEGRVMCCCVSRLVEGSLTVSIDSISHGRSG